MSAHDVDIAISRELLDGILRDATDAYPEECCGLLIGARRDDRIDVGRTRPARNCHPHDRRRRYEIDPQFAFDAFRQAHADGWSVVGFYHSHPDGTTAPSQTDRDESWHDMIYLIIGVREGRSTGVRAWSFDERRAAAECPIRVRDCPDRPDTAIIDP